MKNIKYILATICVIFAMSGGIYLAYHQHIKSQISAAQNQIRNGNLSVEEQATAYLELIKKYPNAQKAKYQLGIIYCDTKQYQKLIHILETCQLQNKHLEAHKNYLLAAAHTQLKQYEQALPYYHQSIQDRHVYRRPFYLQQLAAYHKKLGNLTDALPYLAEILQTYPQYTDIVEVKKTKAALEYQLGKDEKP